jgi:Arylsulfotransferase (ASST)
VNATERSGRRDAVRTLLAVQTTTAWPERLSASSGPSARAEDDRRAGTLHCGVAPAAPAASSVTSTAAASARVTGRGHVIWFKPLDTRGVTDFRVQRYHNQPVLTWWRGRAPPHARNGFYVIYDSTYRKIADVHAGNGLVGDIHEFRITPRDTALITVYHRHRAALAALGGPEDGLIYDGIVQELDIATGRVLFEWHSFPQVGLQESYAKPPRTRPGKKTGPFDYFHVNSVDL